MLTWEDDLEIHALHRRGWSISAIARHTKTNRRTVRNYLNGVTTPGVRKPASVDAFAPFVEYVTARLRIRICGRARCATSSRTLGYSMSYPTLTSQIRSRNLRPVCQDCAHATDCANAVIDHPSVTETRWDWLDLPNPPASWGWGFDGASACRVAGPFQSLAGESGGMTAVPDPFGGKRYGSVPWALRVVIGHPCCGPQVVEGCRSAVIVGTPAAG